MHIHRGQQVHDVGTAVKGNPIELHVLAGGEVGVTGGQAAANALAIAQLNVAQTVLCRHSTLKHLVGGLIKLAGNAGQHPDLSAREHPIGHCYTQHRGVALYVPPVLQTQGFEFISPQFTFEVAFKLVAVLLRAGAHKRAIKIGVWVHGMGI